MQHAETSRLRVVALTEPRRDEAGEPADSSSSDSGLPSPGRYIAEQRTRQGMSIDQLAAATKIPRSSLEFLENDQHDALPGPVFVKGFLRCCARALGVEAETVMELVYERERALLVARRKERPQSAAHAAASPPASKVEPAPSKAESEAPEPKRSQPAAKTPRPPLFSFLGRVRGASAMLWIAVALFVAMVTMAAFNVVSLGGPKLTTLF